MFPASSPYEQQNTTGIATTAPPVTNPLNQTGMSTYQPIYGTGADYLNDAQRAQYANQGVTPSQYSGSQVPMASLAARRQKYGLDASGSKLGTVYTKPNPVVPGTWDPHSANTPWYLQSGDIYQQPQPRAQAPIANSGQFGGPVGPNDSPFDSRPQPPPAYYGYNPIAPGYLGAASPYFPGKP